MTSNNLPSRPPLQKIGAWPGPTGTDFIVWAPLLQKVELVLESPSSDASNLPGHPIPMKMDAFGYWHSRITAPPGCRYRYLLDGEQQCPDPASFHQPLGVHGPSEVMDLHDHPWQDSGWKGLPLAGMIIYELHTGCFSDSHDFAGITGRLDHLVSLGVNTIELMPLAQFAGVRNWGYDGVFPFAIQQSYGGLKGFRQLVDAAHARGIAVLVDVVYNHLGPEGSYLTAFGPYQTAKYPTPWGDALNFDDSWSDGVRNYFLQNTRMWLEDLHVDGLRLDAVHAIKDFSVCHFMQELKNLALDIEERTGRKKILIAEIDLNDPRYINAIDKGGYNLDGQWIDEFHHALHSLITGERNAYYEDFGKIRHLEDALRQTYVYNGIYSPHRKRTFGGKADGHPFSQFVVFAQNHDQIGNRALGDRLSTTLSLEQLKLSAATVLLSPYVPMLFMGEEYGEQNPFQFFVDFGDPALIEGVGKGRRAEFPDFYSDEAFPDPNSPSSFEHSCLSWKVDTEPGASLFGFYRHLIGLRKTRPAMLAMDRDNMLVHPADEATLSFERMGPDDHLYIWLHFGAEPRTITNATGKTLEKIFDTAATEWLGPGSSGESLVPDGAAITLAPYSATVFQQHL